MTTTDHIVAFLITLLDASPVLLAALVGGILALVFWRRAPTSALLVLIACIMQFALVLFSAWLIGWWWFEAKEAGMTAVDSTRLMGIWKVCSGVLSGVEIGLLVWAAFAGRPKAYAVPPPLR